MTQAIQMVVCEACGTPVPRRAPGQRTCGQMRCRDQTRARSVEYTLRMRANNRAWCEANRGCRTHRPWLAGAPPFGPHLPGGGCVIDVFPRPRWALEHRNVRALHGMLSTILNADHEPFDPAFALVPWGNRFGWGAWFWGDRWEAVAGKRVNAVLFDRDVEVRFSPVWRIKAPTIKRRGHQRIRIDAITPVCSQSTDRSITRTSPTDGTLKAALELALPRRLGAVVDPQDIVLDIVSHETQVGTVLVGAKYGVVRGWVGSVVVDVNAVSRWLFECAQTVGLGGRSGFGFGRIRVSEVP